MLFCCTIKCIKVNFNNREGVTVRMVLVFLGISAVVCVFYILLTVQSEKQKKQKFLQHIIYQEEELEKWSKEHHNGLSTK